MHIFNQRTDLLTVVNVTVVHDKNATWARVWIGERHLYAALEHADTKKRCTYNLVFQKLQKTLTINWAFNDIIRDNTIKRDCWKDGVRYTTYKRLSCLAVLAYG